MDTDNQPRSWNRTKPYHHTNEEGSLQSQSDCKRSEEAMQTRKRRSSDETLLGERLGNPPIP